MDSAKIAIVAALEREVRPMIRKWKRIEHNHDRQIYRFYEYANTVLVCGGIGTEAARRATEAIIALYRPELVQSVGFAGALGFAMCIGNIFVPGRVIDASDSSRFETSFGEGTLITFRSVADASQKKKLAQAYSAQAVDMEAAAVARVAERHGTQFRAVKVISDPANFELPEMDRFIRKGRFRSGSFVLHAALRPWLWGKVAELAINSRRASDALCRELQRTTRYTCEQVSSTPQLHLN